MKLPTCLSCRRGRRIALGVLLAPPLLWAALLAVIPTDWARHRIEARLSAASGRQVELGGIRVGLLGQISLNNLSIGAPDSNRDPWLRLAEASIDVNLAQLLMGHLDPTEVDARGLELRVLRRADGSLELADFLQTRGESSNTQSNEPDCPGPTALTVRLVDARITLVDEPTASRLEFQSVEGLAECSGRVADVRELRGLMNGGPFNLVAHLDREGESPSFEGQLRASSVALGGGTNALAYLIPLVAGSSGRVDGRMNLDVYLRGEGCDRVSLRRSVVGHGEVVIDPILLDGSTLLNELAGVVDLPTEGRAGSVRARLALKNGRVATDALTLDVARVPVVLSGWTDFDGRVNYKLKTDNLSVRLGSKARALLRELSIDLDEIADVRVMGTVDALEVTVDDVAVAGPASPRPDRDRLRAIGRRIRDQIQR